MAEDGIKVAGCCDFEPEMKRRRHGYNFYRVIAFLLFLTIAGCNPPRKAVPPTRQTILMAEKVYCNLPDNEILTPEVYKKRSIHFYNDVAPDPNDRKQLGKILAGTIEFHKGPIPAQVHFDCKVRVIYKGMAEDYDVMPIFNYSSQSGVLVDLRHEGNWCVVPAEFQKMIREKIRVFRQPTIQENAKRQAEPAP